MDLSQDIEARHEVCPSLSLSLSLILGFFACILWLLCSLCLPQVPCFPSYSSGSLAWSFVDSAIFQAPSGFVACTIHYGCFYLPTCKLRGFHLILFLFYFDWLHVLSTWWSRIQAYMCSVSIHHNIKRRRDRGTPCKNFQMTYFWLLVIFSPVCIPLL